MIKKYLGDALRILRKSHGITLNELAEKLEISASYISKIENADKTPNMDMLIDYARVFNVKPSVILSFAESLEEDDSLRGNLGKSIVKLMSTIEKWGEL